MEAINYMLAQSREDIEQIIALQRINQIRILDEATIAREGFVTFEYDVDGLWRMNQEFPSVIAYCEGQLAGYCISASPTSRGHYAVLDNMYAYFDTLELHGKPLAEQRWIAMGQVCVAEAFRKMGVFDGMYAHFKATWSAQFDLCLTEISTKNVRSQRAHERVGFRTIHHYGDEAFNEIWAVVAWEF